MKLAVMIDVDGEWMYVPENPKVFKNHPEPKLFDSRDDAQDECDKWNTGIIVDYVTSQDTIRHMTDEERQRAIVRSRANEQR